MNYRSRPSPSGVLCTSPCVGGGSTVRCRRGKQKIYIIIPIVRLLSTAVCLRDCADLDGWDPYFNRPGVFSIRPKWRVNVILTRCIWNRGPKVNKPYSFPHLQSES